MIYMFLKDFKFLFKLFGCLISVTIIIYILLLFFYQFYQIDLIHKYITKNSEQIFINTKNFKILNQTIVEKKLLSYEYKNDTKIDFRFIEESNNLKITINSYYDYCLNIDGSHIKKNENLYTINILSKTNNYIFNKFFVCKKNIEVEIKDLITKKDLVYLIINNDIYKINVLEKK